MGNYEYCTTDIENPGKDVILELDPTEIYAIRFLFNRDTMSERVFTIRLDHLILLNLASKLLPATHKFRGAALCS
jgi:hypothetical protein